VVDFDNVWKNRFALKHGQTCGCLVEGRLSKRMVFGSTWGKMAFPAGGVNPTPGERYSGNPVEAGREREHSPPPVAVERG